MTNKIMVCMDLCVVFFDLLIFTKMILLKNDSRKQRIWMYGGCALIIGCYFAATYVYHWPSSTASAVFMSIPSLVFFFMLSKYKDARFFLTFCFVDSVSLIFAFIGRYIGLLTGDVGSLFALLLLFVIFLAIFLLGRPYFCRYRELLEYVDKGWGSMMICSILIYFALVFFAAYPKPLVERMEYGLSYLIFCAVVISCYAVFITSAIKTSKIYEQSKQLKREKKWHRIAYIDALTGCANRMAYMERINEIERERIENVPIGIAVFDLDQFKQINDTRGHSAGDEVLKATASLLQDVFQDEGFALYRIGGDEFAVIGRDVEEYQIQEKLQQLKQRLASGEQQETCGLSAGYAFVCPDEKNAVEQAFVRADKMMYRNKQSKTESIPGKIDKN